MALPKFFIACADKTVEVREMIVKGAEYDVNFFMNIRPAKGKENIQGNSEKIQSTGTFSGILRGKTDTIEISKRPDDNGSLIKEVKEKIMGEINRNTDADSLQGLKEQISTGKYVVDADEMAKILSE